jgi:hypothetical protein
MTRVATLCISAAALVLIMSMSISPVQAQITFNSYQMTENALADASVDVAVDADENLYYVYVRDGNVYYKRNLNDEELIGAGSSPAIAVSVAGIPHIVYISGGAAVYTNRAAGSWSAGVSLANGSTGFVDIDVDGSGKAHIVYQCNADGDGYGEIVYVTNASGSFVETMLADGWYDSGSGNYYYNPNIKVDGAGKYHVVFEQQNWGGRASWSNKHLTLVSNYASGSYSSETFDWNAGVTTGRNSLALDAHGHPHVLYYSGSTIYYGYWAGGWCSFALTSGSQGAIASDGLHIAIAYNDGANNIRYTEEYGWGFEYWTTVSSGSYPSVAVKGGRHIMYEKSDGSDVEIFLSSDLGPLPVQLVSFIAIPIGQDVTLQWQTVSELNNYGFYVQRLGTDGITYTDIDGSFVAGHGTTVAPSQYSYTDRAVPQGAWYRLRQVDLDGAVHYSEPVRISGVTGVTEETPAAFQLSQNYPNPFNPSTQIAFGIAEAGQVRLVVYDQLGREVVVLVNGQMEPGRYSATFNAAGCATGVYFARLMSGGRTDLRRMMLVR